MKLILRKTILVTPSQPFSFDKTFYKPSHFPSKLEYFRTTPMAYYMPLNLERRMYGVKFQPCGEELAIKVYSSTSVTPKELDAIRSELNFRFTLDLDYSEFYQIYSKDRFLKNILRRNKGRHISTNYSLFHHLLVSVLLQNTTIKRTISMCDNLLSVYGIPIEFDNVRLVGLREPSQFKISEDDLRALKLGYRAKSITRLSRYFDENNLTDYSFRSLETALLEKELLKIFGVGKQTVFYLSLSQFHRTEYLRHIPPWERKILSRLIFKKGSCEENTLLSWFHRRYGNWAGYALSLIHEDVFSQHRQTPIPWLEKLIRDK